MLTNCDSTTLVRLALCDLSTACDFGDGSFLQHLSFGLWLCALSLTCLAACHCISVSCELPSLISR